MKNHHNVLSQAAERMQFAGNFEPNLSDAEKMEAAAKFDDVVQSTLLRFADKVKTRDHDVVYPDRVRSILALEIPQDDNSLVNAFIESEHLDDGAEIQKISVSERQEGYGVREYHRYYIEDGAVLRYDASDMRQRHQFRRMDYVKELQLAEEKASRRPVGVDEINKLAELLESESVRPDKYL